MMYVGMIIVEVVSCSRNDVVCFVEVKFATLCGTVSHFPPTVKFVYVTENDIGL